MVFAIELGVAMILSIPITYIIIQLYKAKDRKLIFGDKLEDNQDDNPLLLTIQAMESELDELRQNNAYMKHIQKLEEQIQEARAHAEALSKVAGNYGNTMEEVGESIVGGIGGRNTVHTVTPVDSNGIVVGGILSKGLVIEKPEEVGESMRHSTPNRKKLDGGSTRQNTAIYRTYTSQKGWSSYYDVKLK